MEAQAQYMVDVKADSATVLVVGRASYVNCMSVSDFFERIFKNSLCRTVYVDFRECLGMDSTFLGILAGVSLKLRRMTPAGKLVLRNLGERNLELVENLGLDKICEIDANGAATPRDGLEYAKHQGPASHAEILKAHENLIEADSDNFKKFEDVVVFLRKELEAEHGKE